MPRPGTPEVGTVTVTVAVAAWVGSEVRAAFTCQVPAVPGAL